MNYDTFKIDPNVKYKIKWLSKITGEIGQGKAIFDDPRLANLWVNGLNQEHKYLYHWTEQVDTRG